MIEDQKWYDIGDRWAGILRYAQEITTGHVYMFDELKKRNEKVFKIINKNDLTEWKIALIHSNPFKVGHEGDLYLVENDDDIQNIQHKSLTIEELDELFYPYELYESIIILNRDRFLDVPYMIRSYNSTLIFQQKLDDSSYIYLMNFCLEDDEDPQLKHLHQTLVTLDKTEIWKAEDNPDQVFEEQIRIFRMLKKEGIVKR